MSVAGPARERAGASAEEQVEDLFLGSDFGDEELSAKMRRELLDRISRGRPLRVYAGYDPSKPDIHLGHSITLRKLRRFQEYGHQVTVVVGTFTALVGDTSDKKDQRARLGRSAVFEAANTYAEQVGSILDLSRTDVQLNHTWLDGLTASEIVELAAQFTVQQFQMRSNYRERLKSGRPIGLHEFLYALFQGNDAVHLQADVQIGATEQLFNILAGRRLQRHFGQEGCTAITYPILVGTDGVERMSKSKGNYVGITEAPDNQYGKVMSVSDETMEQWIPLITGWNPAEVADILTQLKHGSLHPMACKKRLASRVVELYHGGSAASAAEAAFESVHQQGAPPQDVPSVVVGKNAVLLDALLTSGAAKSRSEARRLVAGRGVALDGVVVDDPDQPVPEGALLRVGKRRFFRLAHGDGDDGSS